MIQDLVLSILMGGTLFIIICLGVLFVKNATKPDYRRGSLIGYDFYKQKDRNYDWRVS